MAYAAAAETPEVEDKESPALAEETATAASVMSDETAAATSAMSEESAAFASAISEEAAAEIAGEVAITPEDVEAGKEPEHLVAAPHPEIAGEAAITPEDAGAGKQPGRLDAAPHPEIAGEAAITPEDAGAGKQPEHLAEAPQMDAIGAPAMADQAVVDAPAMAHEAAAAAAAADSAAAVDTAAIGTMLQNLDLGGFAPMMQGCVSPAAAAAATAPAVAPAMAAAAAASPAAAAYAAAGCAAAVPPAVAPALPLAAAPEVHAPAPAGAAAAAAAAAPAASPPLDPEARAQLEHHFLDLAKFYKWPRVKALLDETPDLINVQPAGRWSALHQAAEEGGDEMIHELLRRRADTNLITRDGRTPLEVARGKGYMALRDILHPKLVVVPGPHIRVKVIAQLSGELLGEVECRTTDTMVAFGRIFRWQDPAGPNHSYIVFAGGQKLEPTGNFSEAGVEDGAAVGVLREKGPAAEVETLEDLWEHRPGTRYPIVLDPKLRPLFFATEECLDEDQVEFSNIDFGGGFQRIFVNQVGRPKETYGGHLNYIQVYVLSTKKLEIVKIRADEARFGGIVIQPGEK